VWFFEICKRTDKPTDRQTDKQTNRHTDTLITILHTSTGGELTTLVTDKLA